MRIKQLLQLILYIGGLLLVHFECALPKTVSSIFKYSHNPPYPFAPNELIAENDTSTHNLPNSDDSHSFPRSRKNSPPPDKLKELIDKSSILARISNGIALQSGLMDGSIKIEDAVAELLNFGTLKVSDVVGFKVDSVKQLAGKMKQLPTSLDKAVVDLETAALKWNELRLKADELNNYLDIPKKGEYFQKLKDFKTALQDDSLDDVQDTVTSVNDLLNIFQDVNIGKRLANVKENELYQNFVSFRGYFDELFKQITELKTNMPTLDSNGILADGNKMFGPIETVVTMIKSRYGILTVSSTESIDIMKANLLQVKNLLQFLDSSRQASPTLTSLIKSRTFPDANEKKTTVGFLDGALDLEQLSKDVWDSWIENFTNDKVTGTRLANSLKPIIEFQKQLADLNEKLKPLSLPTVPLSFLEFSNLQNILFTIKSDPIGSETVIDNFEECGGKGTFVRETGYKPTLDAVQAVKKLTAMFIGLKDSVQQPHLDKLKNEYNTFFSSFGFEKFEDVDKSKTQLITVIQKMRASKSLEKFKTFFVKATHGLNTKVSDIKETIDTVLNGENDVDNFLGLSKEKEVHDCLVGLKDEPEILITAIGVIQQLRDLDSAKVQNVENLASAVSSVKNELKSLGSIPDTMKKDAKEITTEINQWPESLKSSGEIGRSVALLSQANDFKTLVSSGDLDKFDAPVQAQIEAIKDGDEQKRIKTLWGNHSEFLNTIKIANQEIETTGANLKLAEIKTFEDYGTVMKKSLEGMKDVKIDVKNKVEALDALISLPMAPDELEKIKKTLQHLESLDLAFSSHSSHFQKVPNALKSLYDFLVTFSIEPTQAPPLRSGNAPPTQVVLNSGAPQNDTVGTQNEEKKDDYLILSIVLPLLVILISITIAIYLLYRFKMLCFKPKGYVCPVDFMDEDESHLRPVSEDLMVIMVSKQVYMTHAEFFVFWMKLLMLVKNEKRNENRPRPYRKLNKLKYYDISILLNPWSTPQTVRIHGNFLRTWRNVFLAMQSPMEQSDIHMDTRSDFYALIIQDEVEFVVKLGPTPASGSYYCERVGEKMIIDSYEIETVSAQPFPEGPHDVVFRKIKVSLVKDGKKIASRTFSQFQYTTWTEDFLPPNFELCYRLMEVITVSSKPIVVHCTTGTDRTMAFIGLEYVSRHMELHDGLTFEHSFAKLTEKRFNSFCSAQSIGWLQAGCIYFLTINHGLDLYMSQRAHSVFWEMVNDGTGVPQIAHGTRWT
ncbi:hypothetical protein GCK72_015531 [Caenorhabditis remanei]|uniref:Tyrosine-protein phosphatase domain-containing protein n=1 Tax=Caenorhabditis remanei TaxID=31234 RepID=A0A6A5GWS5_CAERE|nr:hypothetical protein GCK72_015531 [Caenorhabditis remanei]KAF1759071.1 hypothetical protein GCK72_015531 [Caenorhabditis remanei]